MSEHDRKGVVIDTSPPPPLPPPRDELEWTSEAMGRVERIVFGAGVIAAMVLYLVMLAGAIVMAVGAASTVSAAEPPRAAQQYQRELTREARAVFGVDAPVPVLAAQIHQESAWRPDAESPYAQGLTQFTPATAEWIAEIYPQLGPADVWNPQWAIRAMVRYDRHLMTHYGAAGATACDRWAFTLSSYNGGAAWLQRDIRVCREAPGCPSCDPSRWFGHVADHPDARRADWAVEENRGYPRRILLTLQPRYRHWGPEVACRAP